MGILFPVSHTLEEKPSVEYKPWSELYEEGKESLRAMRTDENVAEVVKALKGGKFTRVRGETPLSEEDLE